MSLNIYSILNKLEDVIISNSNVSTYSYINKTDATNWTVETSVASSSYYYKQLSYGGLKYFSVSYGRPNGFTASSDAYLALMKSSKAIYATFKNMLCPFGLTTWKINLSTLFTNIMAIQFNQTKFKDGINALNLTFGFNSGTYTISTASVKGFVALNINQANCSYLVTGSTQVGIVYGDLGLIVMNCPISYIDTNNSSTVNTALATAFSTGTKNMVVQYVLKVKSMYYVCRVKNKTFNFSNNPTFTNTSGALRYSTMQAAGPTVYITGIGLYNENNLLLAIAKPSKPIKKNFQTLATVQIKLEF